MVLLLLNLEYQNIKKQLNILNIWKLINDYYYLILLLFNFIIVIIIIYFYFLIIIIYYNNKMPPKGLVKGSQEMRDYMKMIRSKKKGNGILDMVKSGAKSLAKMGIDAGANKLKDMIGNGKMKKGMKGKGLAGDLLRFAGNKVVDMTGLGMNTQFSIQPQGRLLKGSALYPVGY